MILVGKHVPDSDPGWPDELTSSNGGSFPAGREKCRAGACPEPP